VNRTVLVIGGTRFVGRLLVARLIAHGDRVTLFNRGTHENPFGDRVEHVRGDRATDLSKLGQRRFDGVVDFAAYNAPDVQGAIDTLDTDQYVFISTGSVYMVREGLTPPFREEDFDGPLIPRDDEGWDYGVGKRACEDLLVATPGFPSTRLRIPVVNGPRDYSGRLQTYVRRIFAGQPLGAKNLSQRVRHVDAMEVARTIDLLLGDRRALGQVFNQTQDETPTLRELFTMLMRSVGLEVPIVESDLPIDDSPFNTEQMSFLDPAKIRAFGIDHAPLQQTLSQAVGHMLGELSVLG
jgi:nucleoside-diphosphate-sugar epimerase